MDFLITQLIPVGQLCPVKLEPSPPLLTLVLRVLVFSRSKNRTRTSASIGWTLIPFSLPIQPQLQMQVGIYYTVVFININTIKTTFYLNLIPATLLNSLKTLKNHCKLTRRKMSNSIDITVSTLWLRCSISSNFTHKRKKSKFIRLHITNSKHFCFFQ